MTAPVTVIGEALIDIVVPVSGESSEHVGGSPANVAIGLARLGHPAQLATHIGTDPRGERIQALLEAENVTLLPGSTTATRTPTATANLDAAGVASYVFDLEWELDANRIEPAVTSHLHTGSIGATLSPGGAAVARIVASCRDRVTISYDPNARPTLMGEPQDALLIIENLIRLSDVVKASSEDIEWLYPGVPAEQVLANWAGMGVLLGIITTGGEAAVVHFKGQTRSYPVLPTTVADTVGAGDSFMSGLLSGLLDANLLGDSSARQRLAAAEWPDVEPAISRALATAAITVSRVGANPPTRAEIAG